MWLGGNRYGMALISGNVPQRQDRAAARNPLWNFYKCADDAWISFSMNQSDRYFPFMCAAIGHPELLDDERFIGMENRTEHRRELIAILDSIFVTKTRPEWTEILNKSADIVWERVQDVFDLPDDPQVIANNYLVDFDHPVLGPTKWLQTPLGYNKTPLSTRKMAPAHGENTEEVLMEALGYTWDDIGALQEAGAIL